MDSTYLYNDCFYYSALLHKNMIIKIVIGSNKVVAFNVNKSNKTFTSKYLNK